MDPLKAVIKKHDLAHRSIDHFWVSFEKYREDEPVKFNKHFKRFDKDRLRIYVANVAYWPKCATASVAVKLKLCYENRYIGYYEIFYNPDGTYEDDYLVTYPDLRG